MRASEHATAWGGHMNNPLRAAILNTILMMGAGAAAALPAAAAEQAAAQTYDIPAGELDAALQQWARQSGQQLLYAGRLVAGKRSDGLSGRYVPGDALQRLLLGSGLKPERLNTKTLVLKTAPMPVEPATEVQIGRAHDCTPVTTEHIVCRLLLE